MTTPTESTLPPVQRPQVLRAARARHWQRTRRLTALLLALWLATTFCSVFFARELAGFSLFGWQLSFYLAAQGAALVYLALIAVYALAMRRFDLRFHGELEAAAAADATPGAAL